MSWPMAWTVLQPNEPKMPTSETAIIKSEQIFFSIGIISLRVFRFAISLRRLNACANETACIGGANCQRERFRGNPMQTSSLTIRGKKYSAVEAWTSLRKKKRTWENSRCSIQRHNRVCLCGRFIGHKHCAISEHSLREEAHKINGLNYRI